MPGQSPSWLFEAAQERVGRTRVLLRSPRTCGVDECITLFREAQGYLEWARDSLGEGGPSAGELRAQALALGREIRQAGLLIEHAARCGRHWLDGFREDDPAYTAVGGAIPGSIPSHLSLMG